MDWLTFIDHLIGHLAWPLVVAGLVVFLSLRHRAALDTLLHRVRKARAGPFEAELEEAKAEADRASLPPAPPVRSPPDRDPLSPEEVEEMQRMRMEDTDRWLGFFMEVAERDPFTAVHGSYHRLNVYLYQAAQRLDPERVRRVEVAQGPLGAAAAEVVGLLTREHEKVLHRLGDAVRSVHEWDEQVSRRQAREFVLLVARLVSAVQERLHMLLETRRPP
jgi:hypothetical protein